MAHPRQPVIEYHRRNLTSIAARLIVSTLLLSHLSAPAWADLRTVKLQLKWRPQFQFAGYYMADQLGYYRNQGIKVRIKPGGPKLKPADEVASGRAEFGVGGVEVLSHASRGMPFVSLAAIYQHSPAAILVREDSHIRAPGQLVGHKVARVPGTSNDVEFTAVLKEEGIDPSTVRWVDLDFDLGRLVRGEIEAQSVYSTNEPYLAQQNNISYRLIQPINYGVDFYGDCLFTTALLLRQDPDLVERFRKASLEGWRYAIDHPADTVARLIATPGLGLTKSDRDRLLYEATESKDLIDARFAEIGRQNPDRWGRIQEYLRKQGMIGRAVDPEEFVYRAGGALTTRQLNERVDRARYLMAVLVLFLAIYLIHNWSLRRGIRQKTSLLAATQKDLEARGRVLQSLVELGHTLAQVRDSEAIAASIVEQIRKGTGFDRVGIYLVDEDLRVLRGVVGVNDEGEVEDCSRYTYLLSDFESPIIQVASGHIDYYLTEDAASVIKSGPGVKHNAFVPLRTADRVLGVIAVDNVLSGRPFGEKEVLELRGFADEVALAFHNSRLLTHAEQQQAALALRNRELSALVDFGHVSTSARTVDEVVKAIWKTVREGLGFDRVGIFLKEGDSIRGVIGTDERGRLELTRDVSWSVVPTAGRWTDLMVGHQDYSYCKNLTEEEGVTTRSGKAIKEHILIPLKTQERVIGAIAVDNYTSGRPIREEDASPLVAFARQAATALQSVMLLEALQNSEERLRLLVTSLSETLYSARVSHQDLVPLFYSPRIEELSGFTPEEALGTPNFWFQLVHPDDRDRYKKGLEDILAGSSVPIEYRIVHRTGAVRWVLDTPSPVRDESDSVARIYGALLDITELKHLEEGLRRAQKMETVGTLAGGIAHEFNNLLGIILGNVEFAQMDAGPENPAQRSLSQTRKAVERAADLTKQLLTFSAKMESRRAPACLGKVVSDTVELLQSSLGKLVKLNVVLEEGLPEVSVDAGQIQQVLVNLCVNARDAMPEGGSITIRSKATDISRDYTGRPPNSVAGTYVVLSVSDTGTGMDLRTQERIFEPFFTTKTVGRGTGLGLAVVYGIIDEHRGWIEVESQPGEGTTFSIYLPSIEALAGEVAAPEAILPTALVVDANPGARSTLVDILEGLGYATLTAATASEALAIFWTDSDMVDLVISDSRPAGMDVEQLIANFRDFKPDVPILVSAPNRNGATAPLNGVAAMIGKPYDADEIARAAGVRSSTE